MNNHQHTTFTHLAILLKSAGTGFNKITNSAKFGILIAIPI
ncbi:hypothetical protein SPBRAN_1790 [uncultured Candidatus Thioglobus sp.]|nr:hypothetical protein SPBRAN_1790 [uncultured Candidatus Thioglobus sp.]